MEQTKTSDRDFLDVLRGLNSENINDDPARRDAFFDSLMKRDPEVPSYMIDFSVIYYDRFFEQVKEKNQIPESWIDYSLAWQFRDAIERELGDVDAVEDMNEMLFIGKSWHADILHYLGSIEGMKKIIKSKPNLFAPFKESLLWGLVQRYARKACDPWMDGSEYKARFNKLIVILAEHQKRLSPFGEIPYVLDEQFIESIRTAIKENNRVLPHDACRDLVYRFLSRVPIFNTKRQEFARDKVLDLYDIKDDDKEQIVSEVPSLWDTVIMNSDEIYSDMYSAANKENPLKTHLGAEKEYTIIGVVLSNGERLEKVDISTPDGQGLIDALLADGFKCVAYSITALGNEIGQNNLLYNSNMVTGFVPSDSVSLIGKNNNSTIGVIRDKKLL